MIFDGVQRSSDSVESDHIDIEGVESESPRGMSELPQLDSFGCYGLKANRVHCIFNSKIGWGFERISWSLKSLIDLNFNLLFTENYGTL